MSKHTRYSNTSELLAKVRGNDHEREYLAGMLFLGVSSDLSHDHRTLLGLVFDFGRICERIDDLDREFRDSLKKRASKAEGAQ
jgi:hypothetical protein